MAITTEQVIVEFIADTTQLETAVDTLERTGQVDAKLAGNFKKTTSEINKQAAALKQNDQAFNKEIKTIKDLDKATRTFVENFVKGFEEQVQVELQGAKAEIDALRKKIEETGTKGTKSTVSLRQELKNLTQQIAQAKVNGTALGKEYDALVTRAGELKDAMKDASAEISNTGSDTRGLDNLLGTAQALAGGFAVIQGSAALFGDESEELQKTLLKVNSAMAILQGLQQIQNALQAEGAITLAIKTAQQKISNAQLAIEGALESKNIIVKGAATVAQKALNAAMAANPIGLLITALATVIPLILLYANNARKAAQEQAALDAAIRSTTAGLDAEIAGLDNANKKFLADLNERGEVQSKITGEEINNIKLVQAARKRAIQDANDELARTANATDSESIAKRKELQDRILQIDSDMVAAETELYVKAGQQRRQINEEFLKSQVASINAGLARVAEGSRAQLSLRKELVKAETKLALEAAGLTEGERRKLIAESYKQQLELDAAFQKRQADARIAAINNQLINVEANTVEEFKLRSRLITEQMNSELADIKLSEKEKANIRKQALEQLVLLTKNTNRALSEIALQDEISRNNKILAQRNISDADRLQTSIANLELIAAAEVLAAEGNAAKIKEIYAKRDAAIRDTKKQMILDAVNYEIELTDAKEGSIQRAAERTRNSARSTLAERIAAIKQLGSMEIADIDKRIRAYSDMYDQKLISDKEYNLAFEKLLDQRKAASEKTDEEIRKETRDSYIKTANDILQIAGTITQGLQAIGQERSNNAQIAIDNEKKQLDELLKAGAITEKEAAMRSKRIEQREKELKTQQAKQAKQAAIFNAIINTAQAVVSALAVGPPQGFILAAIVAALGAAQVAAISARPIPKFFKGKNTKGQQTGDDGYEGYGVVGDRGAELYTQGDRMYIGKKPQVVYLGKNDKVYTAQQTREILANRPTPTVQATTMQYDGRRSAPAQELDYGKLAVAIGQQIKGNLPEPKTINIDAKFIEVSVRNAMRTEKLWDRYYSSK